LTGELEVLGCALFGGFGGARDVIGWPLKRLGRYEGESASCGSRGDCVGFCKRTPISMCSGCDLRSRVSLLHSCCDHKILERQVS
jgi:hypothetical protein